MPWYIVELRVLCISNILLTIYLLILSRDVKPSNILYNRNTEGQITEIVLADFDLSSTLDDPNYVRAGTIPYLAPEVASNNPTFDFQCDVWSAAVTFCEVV